MSGTPDCEKLGKNGDDLAALARLEGEDVDKRRADAIRAVCHARLRRSRARGGIRRPQPTPRVLEPTWRALEPALASGLGALYLLAVLQRALLLLRG